MQPLAGLALLPVYYLSIYLFGHCSSLVASRLASGKGQTQGQESLLLDVTAAVLNAACSANYALAYSIGGKALIGIAFFVGGQAVEAGIPLGNGNAITLVGQTVYERRPWLGLALTLLAQTIGVATFHQFLPVMHAVGVAPAKVFAPGFVCDSTVHVGLLYGCLVEGFGGAAFALYDRAPWVRGITTDRLLKAAVDATLAVYYLDYTGFYVNPLNAMSYKLKCGGESLFRLSLIYAFAPISGFLLMKALFRYVSVSSTSSQNATRDERDLQVNGNSEAESKKLQ